MVVKATWTHFAVVVHDVAPDFLPQIAMIVEALEPLIGRELAGAVVPCWHGRPIRGDGGEFGQFIDRAFGEVLQHGFTHRQDRPGLLSRFTGRSDEFVGLPREEVRRRLEIGRALLRQSLGVEPAGFVAPAWQLGNASVEELGECGFRYLAAFGAIREARGLTIPLSTWSWDWGVLSPLGRAGHWLGDLHRRIRPTALPCIVVHPADVDRGYLPRAVDVIDRLLEMGRTPGLFSEFLA